MVELFFHFFHQLHSRPPEFFSGMGKSKKGMSITHIPFQFSFSNYRGPSIRSRNVRRQGTPPTIIHTEHVNPQSGVSRVNKEIADLIARKDPVLNRVNKKSKQTISKQKKERIEARMNKAAAKAVSSTSRGKRLMMIGSISREDSESSSTWEGN